jgi:hypothetical protein
VCPSRTAASGCGGWRLGGRNQWQPRGAQKSASVSVRNPGPLTMGQAALELTVEQERRLCCGHLRDKVGSMLRVLSVNVYHVHVTLLDDTSGSGRGHAAAIDEVEDGAWATAVPSAADGTVATTGLCAKATQVGAALVVGEGDPVVVGEAMAPRGAQVVSLPVSGTRMTKSGSQGRRVVIPAERSPGS